MRQQRRFIQKFFEGLLPTNRITVSEHADLYRVLVSEGSAEPGPWKTSKVPYLKEVMDALSETSPVRELIVMKGAQLGFTEAGYNWLGYIIHENPGATMFVMPQEPTAIRNVKVKFDPMVDGNPHLKSLVGAKGSKDGSNSQLFKSFPGGLVIFSGASSPANLRSVAVKNLFLDELDAFPGNPGGEGSAVMLAEQRTVTFRNRKVYKVSTPLSKQTSLISKEYEKTDKRKWMVPCPKCDHKQELVIDQLKWLPGDFTTVAYNCISCGHEIKNREKNRMVAKGEWVPTNPAAVTATKRGYHINSLYSAFETWEEIAKKYEATADDIDALRTFTNVTLGLPFEIPGDAPDFNDLYGRRQRWEPGVVMNSVVFLTAAADVQKDRIECEVMGWMRGKICQSVDYRVFVGDTNQDEVWDELKDYLESEFTYDDGTVTSIRLSGVDSGDGGKTTRVYEFCKSVTGVKCVPLKGRGDQDRIVSSPKKIDIRKGNARKGSVQLYHVGTNITKADRYSALRKDVKQDGSYPNGFCFFPNYSQQHFIQLTSEKAVEVRGKIVFVADSKIRNEQLDIFVYNRALAEIVGIGKMTFSDWNKRKRATDPILIGDRVPTASKKQPAAVTVVDDDRAQAVVPAIKAPVNNRRQYGKAKKMNPYG